MKRIVYLLLLFSTHALAQHKKGNNLHLLEIAHQKIEAGDYKSAIMYADSVLSLNPNLSDGYYVKSYAEVDLQDYQNALIDINYALEISKSYRYYSQKASIEHLLKNEMAALKDHDRAIYLCPKTDKKALAELLLVRGNFKENLLDYNGALKDINKSIALDNSSSFKYLLRGRIKFNLNDFLGTIQDCDKSIEIDPGFIFEPYYYRGLAKMKIGDQSGILDIKKAKEMAPNDSNVTEAYDKYCNNQ